MTDKALMSKAAIKPLFEVPSTNDAVAANESVSDTIHDNTTNNEDVTNMSDAAEEDGDPVDEGDELNTDPPAANTNDSAVTEAQITDNGRGQRCYVELTRRAYTASGSKTITLLNWWKSQY